MTLNILTLRKEKLVKMTLSMMHSHLSHLRFVMCQLLAPVFQGFFFAADINSTNEANKEGGTHH
jgi:hypothetical protein